MLLYNHIINQLFCSCNILYKSCSIFIYPAECPPPKSLKPGKPKNACIMLELAPPPLCERLDDFDEEPLLFWRLKWSSNMPPFSSNRSNMLRVPKNSSNMSCGLRKWKPPPKPEKLNGSKSKSWAPWLSAPPCEPWPLWRFKPSLPYLS